MATAVAALAVTAASCDMNPKKSKDTGVTTSATAGITVMACDESFRNIMEQEIEVFEYQYPNASILSWFLPEQQCIDSLFNNPKCKALP